MKPYGKRGSPIRCNPPLWRERPTASDDLGLAAVEVAVRDEGTGLYWSGGAFTAASPVWAAASGVSGTASPWSYGELASTATLPLTGAVWTVHARVRDLYGRLAQTQTGVTFHPADRIKEVLGYEKPGFNPPPQRLDGEKRQSCSGADPSSGRLKVQSASVGTRTRSPAMNIATAFAGDAGAGAPSL